MCLVNKGEDADKLPNRELVIRFFQLLTTGFYANTDDGELIEGEEEKALLEQTKAWRRDLWEGFHLIESRLVPRPLDEARPKYAEIVNERRRQRSSELLQSGQVHPAIAPRSVP